MIPLKQLASAWQGRVCVLNPISREFYRCFAALPGHKKWTPEGAEFALTKANIGAWSKFFPISDIDDPSDHIPSLDAPTPAIKSGMSVKPKKPLWIHQRKGVETMAAREVFGFFHKMGTGKSCLIAVGAAELFSLGLIDRAIVVEPPRGIPQLIESQFKEHFPPEIEYVAKQFPASKPMVDFKASKPGQLPVAVLSAGALSSKSRALDAAAFASKGRCALFVDESPYFKNPSAERSKNIEKIAKASSRRYLFSGEPMPLGYVDIYQQFKILDPRIIGHGSFTSFKNEYAVSGGFEGRQIVGYKNQDLLISSIRPHCEFVNLEDCMDMPRQSWHETLFEPSAEHRKAYETLKKEFVIEVSRAKASIDSETAQKICKNAAAKLIGLMQVSSGWFTPSPPNADDALECGDASPKRPAEIVVLNDDKAAFAVETLVSHTEKTLIFASFYGDLDSLARELTKARVEFVEFSGRVEKRQAQENLTEFLENPDVKVFIATTASGGSMLNLQNASRTIYFSNTMNYGNRIQSESRTWRAGQQKACQYWDIMGFPIDRVIRANHAKKGNMSLQLRTLSNLSELAEKI
jgi:hypothetical protein